MSAAIETIHNDVAGYLAADAYFADVPVLNIAKGVTASDIEQALGAFNEKSGKAGAAVLVFMPTARAPKPNNAGPALDLQLEVRVFEMPIVNRATGGTGKTAEAIAARVMQLLHHWSPGAGAIVSEPAAMQPVMQDDTVAYSLFFGVPCQLAPLERARPVTFSLGNDELQLQCATNGASIYYTTDGTMPTPDATQYTDAIAAPESGTTVRAIAFKSGIAASNVTQFTIN